MRPTSRCGQAYLSPQGFLYVVLSDPWIYPWVSETEWLHDVVVFGGVEGPRPFPRGESNVAELEERPGWTRLA